MCSNDSLVPTSYFLPCKGIYVWLSQTPFSQPHGFTGVKPVDDNNEIVEIQSVEEPIYMQELAEQITVETVKEDVTVVVESVEDTTSVHKIIDGSCGKKMERTSVIKYNGYSEIDFQKITQKDLSEIETTSPIFLEKGKVDDDCSENENADEDLRNHLKKNLVSLQIWRTLILLFRTTNITFYL